MDCIFSYVLFHIGPFWEERPGFFPYFQTPRFFNEDSPLAPVLAEALMCVSNIVSIHNSGGRQCKTQLEMGMSLLSLDFAVPHLRRHKLDLQQVSSSRALPSFICSRWPLLLTWISPQKQNLFLQWHSGCLVSGSRHFLHCQKCFWRPAHVHRFAKGDYKLHT